MKRIKHVLITAGLILLAGCSSSSAAAPRPSDTTAGTSTTEPAVTVQAEPTEAPHASFTDEMLCERAKAYYQSVHGEEPPIVEVDSVDGDEVTIHLYEIVDEHTATWDWYTVDRNTGIGTDVLGNEIDLSSDGGVG